MPQTLTNRRFTVDEYYRMAEVGILGWDERVELIEGEILQMATIGSRHGACVKRLNRLFGQSLGERVTVQIQDPVRLDRFSEPEPDVALLRPREDDYAEAHPGPSDVFLLVEVADSTVAFDRERKGPLYAAAAIPEYWLVDVPGDAVDVRLEPAEGRYHEIVRRGRGDVLRPSAFPDIEVPVEAVLP